MLGIIKCSIAMTQKNILDVKKDDKFKLELSGELPSFSLIAIAA